MPVKYDAILGALREKDGSDVGDATESQKGIVQLATVEESIAGANETKAVTPKGARETALSVVSEQAAVYGVLYDPSASSPVCQRVVLNGTQLTSVDSFAELPAHDFKRCVMDDLATRHVNYYLNAHDSTLKADGTAADLTGADGDVMVEIPITYWRYDVRSDGKILYLVSDKEFPGSAIHPFFYVSPDGHTARKQYVGAYQSTICDATGARIANMMNQDATASSAYAAGYKARSVAGCKPWTSMTQATHRTAAGNNGAQGVNSLFHQYLFLMMLIEGGSFNTQEAISPGFAYASTWDYAFTRLAGRANFGNGTGNILMDATQDSTITWQSVADALKVVQFSYRGIENPYGEIWKFEDGIQKYQNVVDGVLTGGCYWWTAATSLYTDVDQNAAASPTYTRVAHSWPTGGYPKTWRADNFLPLTVGGGTTTYLCDYFYNDAAAGSRVVLRGGGAHNGADAGAGCVIVLTGLTTAYSYFGGRLAA